VYPFATTFDYAKQKIYPFKGVGNNWVTDLNIFNFRHDITTQRCYLGILT
jgi:hypothetical protein